MTMRTKKALPPKQTRTGRRRRRLLQQQPSIKKNTTLTITIPTHAISSSPDTTKKSVGPEAPEWHFHWSARPPETSPLGPSSLAVLGRSQLDYLGPMCLACMRSLKDLRQGLPWLSEWIMWIHKIAFLWESHDQP